MSDFINENMVNFVGGGAFTALSVVIIHWFKYRLRDREISVSSEQTIRDELRGVIAHQNEDMEKLRVENVSLRHEVAMLNDKCAELTRNQAELKDALAMLQKRYNTIESELQQYKAKEPK